MSSPTPEHILFMLKLINQARKDAEVAPVELGSNRAAQVHADNSLANCHSGHWSMDGLKPYMRYTLAGGYQVNEENASGGNYCFETERSQSLDTALTEAMAGLMKSDGHRKRILNPTFRTVSLGISWDALLNLSVIQIFEGAYIEYHSLPMIQDGILSLSGTAVGGAGFSSEEDLIVALHWDPPPDPLTRGQVVRVYSHDLGTPIIGIAAPKEGGEPHDRFLEYIPQPSPHSVRADAPPPQSWEESQQLFEEAKRISEAQQPVTTPVPMLGATEWKVSAHDFEVVADVGGALAKQGPGVYTVHVWAVLNEELLIISMYSIWHGIERPGGYQ